MEANERRAIEEAHDAKLRELNRANDLLDDYRQMANRAIDHQADLFEAAIRQLSAERPRAVYQQFEKSSIQLRHELARRQEAVDEAREAEMRAFKTVI